MNELSEDRSIRLLEARLKFRHLRLLVALDEHRNFARAAKSIGLSQPSASKLLADMEKLLGTRLFERLPRGLEPNEMGTAFVRHSRVILSHLGRAGGDVSALKTGRAGVVNVGAFSAPGLELIDRAIRSVRRQNPLAQILVDVGNTDYLMKRVGDGTLDFAIGWITPDIDPSAFLIDIVGYEKFNFICRADHPLTKKSHLRLEDLAGAEWVLQSPDSLVRRATESLFAMNGLPVPEPFITTTSFLSMLVFLRDTDAISVASAAAVRLFSKAGGFRILRVAEPIASEPLGIVSRAEGEMRPIARLFLEGIKEAVSTSRSELPGIPPW